MTYCNPHKTGIETRKPGLTRDKIAKANKGHFHTEESKAKMREQMRLSWQRRKVTKAEVQT